MKINTERFRKPQFIFLIYIAAASLLIMVFRFIFPGSDAPLPIYARNWRLIQGMLEIFNFFPALALSALVIPFAFASYDENYKSFSDMFFKRLVSSVVTAIIAAGLFSVIFFLAFPMAKSREESMRFSGALYDHAKKSAYDARDAGEWFEASHFIAMCDSIWLNSEEMKNLKEEITAAAGEKLYMGRISSRSAGNSSSKEIVMQSEDYQPVDATEAIDMARAAFNEERFFDAHWLANLGERLAVSGSAQAVNAARLSSEAWNMISSLAPNHEEINLFNLFNFKLSGYQAMGTGDWIRAYYIFQELTSLTPNDPDIKDFLARSEYNAKRTAFFIDEMELSLGEILNGAVFSLPDEDGRIALRFSSLTLSEDVAYGFGFDYIKVDKNMNLAANANARYAKLLPFTLNGRPQILVLTHALERTDENIYFYSEWLLGSEPAGGIILDISYEDFMLLARVRQGLSNLQINDLFTVANRLEKAGYVKQIFEAEILNRLGSALFFLPMAIFVIVIAWRYRAKQRPRYIFFLMLPVLPIVFHYIVFMYRVFFNTLGIWLVISIGFTPALIIYIAALAAVLFISLIALSAQHS